MNSLEILKDLQVYIDTIKSILKKKEYTGSGMVIDIFLGNRSRFVATTELGITTGMEVEFLELILTSLERRREYHLKQIIKERDTIETYLKEYNGQK
jgi:hypothetical protein